MNKTTPLSDLIDPIQIATLNELEDRKPAYALVENTDLVVIRFDDEVSALYGRCLHRGALLSDGHVDKNDNLICGVHHWDYRIDSGVSEYNNEEALHKFRVAIDGDLVFVDRADIVAFEEIHPQPFRRDEYLGLYNDTHPENTEPYTRYIQELSKNGLKNYGHHGPSAEIELVLPAELEAGPAQGIVAQLRSGMALGKIGGVGCDLVGYDAVFDVIAVGQAEVLLRRDVAQHRGAEPTDHGRADAAGDVVVARCDVGREGAKRIERDMS